MKKYPKSLVEVGVRGTAESLRMLVAGAWFGMFTMMGWMSTQRQPR
jgi:hypothetical protein